MDNLFVLAKLLRAEYAETKPKTMVHGFFQQKRCGLPIYSVQEYYTKYGKKADDMRGETKSALLEGGVECPDIVFFSVYDTKLVYFLSMEDEKSVWNSNKK